MSNPEVKLEEFFVINFTGNDGDEYVVQIHDQAQYVFEMGEIPSKRKQYPKATFIHRTIETTDVVIDTYTPEVL